MEPKAANTGQNITFSRELLTEADVEVGSLLLICQGIVCASEPLELDDCIKPTGDEKLVVDMLVGDLQRVIEYPKLGR